MNLLILGLILFLTIHLIPSCPKLRETLVGKFKLTGYKAVFGIISIVSMVLIVHGLMTATFVPLYDPPGWGRHLAMLLMLPAIYLFLSNTVAPAPSTAKMITANPVNWAVILWSVSHLLANGDLAHVLLFGTLGLFSIISIITGSMRGLQPALKQRPPLLAEAIFIVIVIIVYLALIWGHKYFTGIPIIPGS